ncbi:MAG: outer membrane lipid asymmetry maintenance protein MlaD [Thermodesulfobacteriota bacterium]
MKDRTIEFAVGVFVVIGLAAMAYISISLGDLEIFARPSYLVEAEFSNTSGLKEGATVEVAGVEVGRVESIELKDFMSTVTMRIDRKVELPEDTIASIRTQGIIGEKFVKLSPGGSDRMLGDGAYIHDTEPAIDIEELISKYIFSTK